MLLESPDVTALAHTLYDVCIVGSGPAGIALALELSRQGIHVLVLEQGAGSEAEDLGQVTGPMTESRPYYLVDANTKGLGGSSHCWKGGCSPFLPGEWAPRKWIAAAGWPFAAAELERYFDPVNRFLGVKAPGFASRGGLGTGPLSLADPDVLTHDYVNLLRPQVVDERRADWRDAKNLLVAMPVRALRFLQKAGESSVRGLLVAGANQARAEIRAKRFVVCGGGVETTRLLFASQGDAPNSFGGKEVGRCFMEHPYFWTHIFFPKSPEIARSLLAHRDPANGVSRVNVFSTSASWQKRARVGSCMWRFQSLRRAPGRRPLPGQSLLKDLHQREGLTGAPPLKVVLRIEQVPDARSRIARAEGTNRFGQPLLQLAWRLGDTDLATISRSARALAKAFQVAGAGHFRERWDLGRAPRGSSARFSNHILGTTRMSARESDGVVDPGCRVYGTKNLYVLSTSVFPVGGAFPPTYTLLALAYRLAEHLRREARA